MPQEKITTGQLNAEIANAFEMGSGDQLCAVLHKNAVKVVEVVHREQAPNATAAELASRMCHTLLNFTTGAQEMGASPQSLEKAGKALGDAYFQLLTQQPKQ